MGKQFAEYGVKRIIGDGSEVAIDGFAITALTHVILPSVRGPLLEDHDGTIGALANIQLGAGDTLALGRVTHVTVPADAQIIVAKLP